MSERHYCPECNMEFTELHIVPTSTMEPFTSNDPMKGVMAYGIYDTPKVLVHTAGEYVHFAFFKVAEKQPADCPPGKVWMEVGEHRLVKMERYDHEAWYAARMHNMANPQPCDEEGCNAEGIACYYHVSDTVADSWYCTGHALKNGFCPGCGMFSAGKESFDFSETGLCESCEAADADYDDGDDDDFNEMAFDDYDDDF